MTKLMTDSTLFESDWDAVVIGAGPAGASMATLLARSGKQVLLIDRAEFPRGKVCGCCLSGRAVATIHRLGFESVLLDAIPVERFRFACRTGQVDLPTVGGLSISREALDATIVQLAVTSGATFLSGWTAEIGEISDDRRIVKIKRHLESIVLQCRVILACGGLGQVIEAESKETEQAVQRHSKIGVGATLKHESAFPSRTIIMATGKAGYVGLVQLPDGRLDLAAALQGEAIKKMGGLSPLIQSLLEECHIPLPQSFLSAEWKGTIPLTRTRRYVAAERVFVLGDAAGYIEPFTGEGMAWAFSGAEELLPIALSAINHWERQHARAWEVTYKKSVARKQWVCRLMKILLNHPAIISPVISTLNDFPQLASPFLRAIHGTP